MIFLFFLLLILPVLLSVAILTLAERKILAGMQRRKGPNKIGIFGLLQPFADALKLLVKETIVPSVSNRVLFMCAPLITFCLSLFSWAVIPFNEETVLVDLDLSVLFVLAISSLGVYGIILAGWSSNSRYGFLGALRSAAQMISYEVSMIIVLLSLVVTVGSFNLVDIVEFQENVWLIIPHFPSFLIFLVSILAETNRPPFDLPEAEAELVSGYNVEYSSAGFALFFIGEYSNIVLMSFLTVLFFLGGWHMPLLSSILGYQFFAFFFFFKVIGMLFFFVWVRAAFPRFRYDQLMRLGWKIFLPFSTGWFLFVCLFLYLFDLSPGFLY